MESLYAAGTSPSEESCAYWLARTPAEWRNAFDQARNQWDSVEVTAADIEAWRAERARTEPSYARTVEGTYIRNVLQARGYIDRYGTITDEEAYHYTLIFQPQMPVALRFDEDGNAKNADNELRAALDRQIRLRSRYEVLRDGLTRVYWQCTDAPEAVEVSRYADSLTDIDISK